MYQLILTGNQYIVKQRRKNSSGMSQIIICHADKQLLKQIADNLNAKHPRVTLERSKSSCSTSNITVNTSKSSDCDTELDIDSIDNIQTSEIIFCSTMVDDTKRTAIKGIDSIGTGNISEDINISCLSTDEVCKNGHDANIAASQCNDEINDIYGTPSFTGNNISIEITHKENQCAIVPCDPSSINVPQKSIITCKVNDNNSDCQMDDNTDDSYTVCANTMAVTENEKNLLTNDHDSNSVRTNKENHCAIEPCDLTSIDVPQKNIIKCKVNDNNNNNSDCQTGENTDDTYLFCADTMAVTENEENLLTNDSNSVITNKENHCSIEPFILTSIDVPQKYIIDCKFKDNSSNCQTCENIDGTYLVYGDAMTVTEDEKNLLTNNSDSEITDMENILPTAVNDNTSRSQTCNDVDNTYLVPDTVAVTEDKKNLFNKDSDSDSTSLNLDISDEFNNGGEFSGGNDMKTVDQNGELHSTFHTDSIHRTHNKKNNSASERDSEYMPSETDSDSNCSSETDPISTSISNKNLTRDSLSSTVIQNGADVPDDGCLIVKKAQPKGKNKSNFCYFCHKMQTNIVRHLETVHANENDVKKFSLLPKGNRERRKIIDTIRKNGNFIYNTDSRHNTGELLVTRRPSATKGRGAKDFTCCSRCKGFYTKNNIRHHFKECSGRAGQRAVQILGRKVTGRLHSSACDVLRNRIFPVLREDDVVRVIRYDELVIAYGNKLCGKYKPQHQHDMIRSRLRALGRFFMEVRQINPGIENFSQIYQPIYYDDCVKAIYNNAKYNSETGNFGAPSAATRLGCLLKQVGSVFITMCIKKDNEEGRKNAENFLKILTEDATVTVNKVAEEIVTQRKRHARVDLPETDDILKLHEHLSTTRNIAYTSLLVEYQYEDWLKLAETTLIMLQLFNRRRAGEIERITIEDYRSHQGIDEKRHTEIFHSLSEEARKVARRYKRFEIRGKLGRTVPVLLSQELLASIEMILKYRTEAKVPIQNPYVFGIFGYDNKRFKYLKACQLMRKFATECGATSAATLRGTKLRKHIATKCITLNLSENQITDLANFMGHHEKIHKSHYRQPIPELEIVRMSKLLEIAQGEDEEVQSSSSEDEAEELIAEDLTASDTSIPKTKHSKSKFSYIRKRSTSPYGPTKRIRWSTEERSIVLRQFQNEVRNKRIPSGKSIEELRQKTPILKLRSVPQIRSFIHNCISGKVKFELPK